MLETIIQNESVDIEATNGPPSGCNSIAVANHDSHASELFGKQKGFIASLIRGC
jgi:hypothetical protein